MATVLELRDITKRFPGVLANDKINLTLEKGEILGLLGENGAGKTTLMNILYGLYQPDEGQIFVKGNQVKIHSPGDAIASGVGMVHQHFMLVPVFTVTENVMLGTESIRRRMHWLMTLVATVFGLAWAFFTILLRPYFFDALFKPSIFPYMTPADHNALILTAILMFLSGPIAFGCYIGLNYLLGGFLDRASVSRNIRSISKQYGLEVDPKSYIKDLPVGVQQRVEIIKLLYRNAEVLILDEPTAVLTPQEVNELFKIMNSLIKQGKSIIFITHKLREVLDCADRITVLRRGKVVGTTTPKEANQAMLASMMVGRAVILEVKKSKAKPGELVLQVDHLEVTDDRRQISVEDVSFDVHKGEVVGIAGVQGNGQTELVEAITGLRPVANGSFTILGKSFGKKVKEDLGTNLLGKGLIILLTLLVLFFSYMTIFAHTLPILNVFSRMFNLKLPELFFSHPERVREIYMLAYRLRFFISLACLIASIYFLLLAMRKTSGGVTIPRKVIELGTSHIPEDRQRDGLVLGFPVSENLVLCNYYRMPFARNIWIRWPVIRRNAFSLIKQFDIRTPSEETLVSNLSGGNQQKVIVARELSRDSSLLIAAQPTRGLDVGSIEYIHSQIIKKRDEGVAVLVVSTELDEIMQLSDRIAVMFRGRIVATLPMEQATKELIGLLMAGVPLDHAHQQIKQHKIHA
jgi:ABC-type uncharacterized transport system ATPase subunit